MQWKEFTKTPLRRIQQDIMDADIWVKDESFNPTGTFKDRLAWSLTRQLIQEGTEKTILISCITLGNTVKSVGYFFSSAFSSSCRPQILGLFPLHFSQRIIGPDSNNMTITGKDLMQYCRDLGVICLETDLESRFLTEQDIRDIATGACINFETHRDISYGIGEEAYSKILREALDEMSSPPSIICVPVGAGVLFDECVKLVQRIELDCTVVGVSVIRQESIADKIYGYYSPYFKALRTNNIAFHSVYTRHPVLVVSDEEIGGALKILSSVGIDAEPSAAAAFVPLLNAKYKENIPLDTKHVLVINTGNGMHRLAKEAS